MKKKFLVLALSAAVSGCVPAQDNWQENTDGKSVNLEVAAKNARLPFNRYCDNGRAVYVTKYAHAYQSRHMVIIDNAPDCAVSSDNGTKP